MSRDDESPKYELNMTDYDEGGLGVLRVEVSAGFWLAFERPALSQICLLNILGHARIYVFYLSVRGRVTNN